MHRRALLILCAVATAGSAIYASMADADLPPLEPDLLNSAASMLEEFPDATSYDHICLARLRSNALMEISALGGSRGVEALKDWLQEEVEYIESGDREIFTHKNIEMILLIYDAIQADDESNDLLVLVNNAISQSFSYHFEQWHYDMTIQSHDVLQNNQQIQDLYEELEDLNADNYASYEDTIKELAETVTQTLSELYGVNEPDLAYVFHDQSGNTKGSYKNNDALIKIYHHSDRADLMETILHEFDHHVIYSLMNNEIDTPSQGLTEAFTANEARNFLFSNAHYTTSDTDVYLSNPLEVSAFRYSENIMEMMNNPRQAQELQNQMRVSAEENMPATNNQVAQTMQQTNRSSTCGSRLTS